jgi:hypothetical protein
VRGLSDGKPLQFFGNPATDSGGVSLIKLPHGVQNATIEISTDWCRVRTKPGAPLGPGMRFPFVSVGTLDSDRSLDVVVYDSPQVIVLVKCEGAGTLKNVYVAVRREGDEQGFPAQRLREDHQFRLLAVPVDKPFTLVVSADGYQRVERECDKLPEGAKKEMVIILRKKKS